MAVAYDYFVTRGKDGTISFTRKQKIWSKIPVKLLCFTILGFILNLSTWYPESISFVSEYIQEEFPLFKESVASLVSEEHLEESHYLVYSEEAQQEKPVPCIDEYPGCIYPYSSCRDLSAYDIQLLKSYSKVPFSKLLQIAINELFARHGHQFQRKEYFDYYNQFSWYASMEKHTVEWDEFTDIEKQNLSLLISTKNQL